MLCTLIFMFTGCEVTQKNKLKALIIDGQNNHGVWPKTTIMMKRYLEETRLFDVDIQRTTYMWQGPHFNKMEGIENIEALLDMYPIDDIKRTALEEPKPDPQFSPNFKDYDVVISNFGWKTANWSDTTKKNFEDYMINGGGFVLIHAANNAWGDWEEYNKIIALGGWGGRSTESGPYVYYDIDNTLRHDTSEGPCASHGPQLEYQLKTRAPEHPIMKGLPDTWLHSKDELYERLRGPAKNMTVLATAFSGEEADSTKENKNEGRTGRHEPLLMAVEYGKGRIFHSALGHMDYSMECVGFITTLQRGAEWAATGNVTQNVPNDFPTKDGKSIRKFEK
ncbi:ThuA domain-containing protein [Flavivirga amylovorans]|uniref:ThuA domain-containing protein n=1 Tax=Flavivirga amylovorans TaxID=870486 RepID=A0ABT8X4I3_9FLAO|nr:ThuA domain-containing protein [Flavivirga amylovorans]MDO5988752.1 ThuA domain-containing protein [Flavivirga amylovorans]